MFSVFIEQLVEPQICNLFLFSGGTLVQLRHLFNLIYVVLLMVNAPDALAASIRQSDDQIRQLIIDESIASYPGVCACPFNSARNGSSCGRRSAWSKQGGYAPICYKKEIPKEMVDEWRKGHDA